MATLRFLLAPAKVATVISTINKQVTIVTSQVTNPVNTIVNQVVGGVWKGDGANRFVEEMTKLVRPQLSTLTSAIANTGPQISKAMETMQDADKFAASMMNNNNAAGGVDLVEYFKGIYR